MLLLKSVGQQVCYLAKTILFKVESNLLGRAQVRNIKVKVFILACIILLLILVFSALVTTYVDDLTFLEGIYMWCCSYTTIGFGDYVPYKDFGPGMASTKNPALYYFLTGLSSILFVLGLATTAGTLNAVVDALDELRNGGFSLSRMCGEKAAPTDERHDGEELGLDNSFWRVSSVITGRERAHSF